MEKNQHFLFSPKMVTINVPSVIFYYPKTPNLNGNVDGDHNYIKSNDQELVFGRSHQF